MSKNFSEFKIIIEKEINNFQEFQELLKAIDFYYSYDSYKPNQDGEYFNEAIEIFNKNKDGVLCYANIIDRYILNLIEENKNFTFNMVVKSLKDFLLRVFKKIIDTEVVLAKINFKNIIEFDAEIYKHSIYPLRYWYDSKFLSEIFEAHFFQNHAYINKFSFALMIKEMSADYPETISAKRFKEDRIEEWKNYRWWFLIGVSFAKGDIKRVFNEKNNFREVARVLFEESAHPYVSSSWNNTSQNDKNIFSAKNKIEKIISHCNKNNIEICESFKTRANL